MMLILWRCSYIFSIEYFQERFVKNREMSELLIIDRLLKEALVITNNPLSLTAQGPSINYLVNKPPKQWKMGLIFIH